MRRKVAEAGLDYSTLETAANNHDVRKKLVLNDATPEDIEEIVQLVESHFNLGNEQF